MYKYSVNMPHPYVYVCRWNKPSSRFMGGGEALDRSEVG